MISVAEALEALFALVRPTGTEEVSLTSAAGRVLVADAVAKRNQPPFDASAMDGYALRGAEVHPGASFRVVGEAAAGHGWAGTLQTGEALRIFTGAPVPAGGDRIIIQEDVTRVDDTITLGVDLDSAHYVRAQGSDFAVGDRITAPRRLTPADVALLAAMNIPRVTVARAPVIAVLATGDELALPGENPGPDQIIASNSFGLAAMLQEAGAQVRLLPVARDSVDSLTAAIDLAQGADVLVTIGGASVGDHDLVADAAATRGLERQFYKVAMRPGKPLMAGRMGEMAMIGLPGNPVSAMVCGEIFLSPFVDAMLGLPCAPRVRATAPLAHDIGPNGPREHYMRAHLADGVLRVFDRQDSALLTVLSSANALVVRAPRDPARAAGEMVEFLTV